MHEHNHIDTSNPTETEHGRPCEHHDHHSHEHHSHHNHAHHEHHSHHGHTHGFGHHVSQAKILTIRSHSGLSGDMFVCGLLKTLDLSPQETNAILNGILPSLQGSVELTTKEVNNICGWHCEVKLPHEHVHRNLVDVLKIISEAQMSEDSKKLAEKTFRIVASSEAQVHNKPIEEVHFHEVGALDSILDICFTCELFTRLNPDIFVVSPLPIADGVIHCAHGAIPSPAPAVQQMLTGIPVKPFDASGETVTPTALALLKAMDPEFGGWPKMLINKINTVYGTYEYPGVPNGAIFAYGQLYD